MTIDQFWELIARSRNDVTDTWEQHTSLTQLLTKLDEAEILSFASHFTALNGDAYRWDLWAVVYIIEGGCSDDGFLDFRAWLISQGREFFYKCMRTPEAVAERATDSIFYEEMTTVDVCAYEKKTGRSFVDVAHLLPSLPQMPAGLPWKESELPQMYPELCKKFKFTSK